MRGYILSQQHTKAFNIWFDNKGTTSDHRLEQVDFYSIEVLLEVYKVCRILGDQQLLQKLHDSMKDEMETNHRRRSDWLDNNKGFLWKTSKLFRKFNMEEPKLYWHKLYQKCINDRFYHSQKLTETVRQRNNEGEPFRGMTSFHKFLNKHPTKKLDRELFYELLRSAEITRDISLLHDIIQRVEDSGLSTINKEVLFNLILKLLIGFGKETEAQEFFEKYRLGYPLIMSAWMSHLSRQQNFERVKQIYIREQDMHAQITEEMAFSMVFHACKMTADDQFGRSLYRDMRNLIQKGKWKFEATKRVLSAAADFFRTSWRLANS